MRNCRRNSYSCDSNTMSVIISLIFGGVVGALYFFALLPSIITGTIVAAVVALVILILFWISVISRKPYSEYDCVCENLAALITGVIGTLITSFIIFSITLVTGSTIYAILVGLLAFFFALTLISGASYLSCLTDCDCDCDCD